MNGYVSKLVRKEELEAALHTYTQILMTVDSMSDEQGIEYSDEPEQVNSSKVVDLPTVTITSEDNINYLV
jgi:hypothetical protein